MRTHLVQGEEAKNYREETIPTSRTYGEGTFSVFKSKLSCVNQWPLKIETILQPTLAQRNNKRTYY